MIIDEQNILEYILKKSRIRETTTLSTDADSRTNTNLKRLRDLSIILYTFFFTGIIFTFENLKKLNQK